jgi:hypothetical protein
MPNLPEALFPTTDPDLSLSLGRYTIYSLVLGAGSYGVIYLASAPTASIRRGKGSHGKQAPMQVAVKLCHRCVVAEPGSTMVDEVELLRHVQHPNVLGLLDYVHLANTPRTGLVVMELVTGGDLCTSDAQGARKVEVLEGRERFKVNHCWSGERQRPLILL